MLSRLRRSGRAPERLALPSLQEQPDPVQVRRRHRQRHRPLEPGLAVRAHAVQAPPLQVVDRRLHRRMLLPRLHELLRPAPCPCRSGASAAVRARRRPVGGLWKPLHHERTDTLAGRPAPGATSVSPPHHSISQPTTNWCWSSTMQTGTPSSTGHPALPFDTHRVCSSNTENTFSSCGIRSPFAHGRSAAGRGPASPPRAPLPQPAASPGRVPPLAERQIGPHRRRLRLPRPPHLVEQRLQPSCSATRRQPPRPTSAQAAAATAMHRVPQQVHIRVIVSTAKLSQRPARLVPGSCPATACPAATSTRFTCSSGADSATLPITVCGTGPVEPGRAQAQHLAHWMWLLTSSVSRRKVDALLRALATGPCRRRCGRCPGHAASGKLGRSRRTAGPSAQRGCRRGIAGRVGTMSLAPSCVATYASHEAPSSEQRANLAGNRAESPDCQNTAALITVTSIISYS